MRTHQLAEEEYNIVFTKSETAVLLAANDHLYRTPQEVIEASLSSTLDIMARTFASQNKLQKSVDKFNEENKTALGIADMQALINRSHL